jgi:hypothetical protein
MIPQKKYNDSHHLLLSSVVCMLMQVGEIKKSRSA